MRIFGLFFLVSVFTTSFGQGVTVGGLTCQGYASPIGLDEGHPVFGWKLSGVGMGAMQRAYQVLVATSAERLTVQGADVWNSGRVEDGRSVGVRYGGEGLKARAKYYWKVLVWTGAADLQSKAAQFEMGLMGGSDWTARWIGLDSAFSWDRPGDTHSQLSARYFRKEFSRRAKVVRQARLYFTGVGLYKLFLNGQRVGDEELAPAATNFEKRVYYTVFDVTRQLSTGERNTIGVVLGNGRFFSMRPGETGKWKDGIPTIHDFGMPKMICQLEIAYTDGSRETVVSDPSWQVTSDGPIRSNSEFDGEVYDPNKAMKGWERNGFDTRRWLAAAAVAAPGGVLQRQPNPAMKVMKTLRPVSVHPSGARRFIVDMGQNMAGWVSLKVMRSPNVPIVLRYAEKLKGPDSLYRANLRGARVTDSIASTGGREVLDWHPSFTFHGFRYVEITGVEQLKASDIEGQLVYDEMANTGDFHCSDSLLNRIFRAAWWTIASNYKGIPVDCPQRDERMGWLGDRSANSYGESFLFDNYFVYSKWLDDIADEQQENGSLPDIAPRFWRPFLSDNMTWPSTYLFVAKMLYQQFGDRQVVVKHYGGMKRWMTHMKEYFNADSLIDRDTYGDWCVPPESPDLILSKDSTRLAPKGLIASAYYVGCLRMMEEFAVVSGHFSDTADYARLRASMIEGINRRYLHRGEGYYGNNTITSNLLALAFDIVPASLRATVAGNIVRVSADRFDNHVGTGLVGNQWLMRGLTENGHADIAYRIATNKTYPSWGYMLEDGATTIWELWNGNTANPAMNSGNHVMLLGDLLIWYYERLAGIQAAEPGFRKIVLKPLTGLPLHAVRAEHVSPYGKIVSDWRKEGGRLFWDVVIPGNSTGLVYVPAGSRDEVRFEKGSGRYVGAENGFYIYELLPGHYGIQSKI